MIVMDSQTGKEIANLPTVEGMDGVYFDPRLKRIYISGAATLTLDTSSPTSRKMPTITKPSGKYPRNQVRVPRFGPRS